MPSFSFGIQYRNPVDQLKFSIEDTRVIGPGFCLFTRKP